MRWISGLPGTSEFLPGISRTKIQNPTGFSTRPISLRNDETIISSISVTDIFFDVYLGKWNYRVIPKVKTWSSFLTIPKQLNQLGNALGSFLVAVALISLIVGSIGIMNIMLVTVTERTREIGIMKALGFSSMDILLLFLVESVIISLFGGLLGLGLGIGGAYVVMTFLKLPFFYSPYIFEAGLLVALIVGVVAGVYPASKAAKLTPVDALRYQ